MIILNRGHRSTVSATFHFFANCLGTFSPIFRIFQAFLASLLYQNIFSIFTMSYKCTKSFKIVISDRCRIHAIRGKVNIRKNCTVRVINF